MKPLDSSLTLGEVVVLYPRVIGPWLVIETAADRRLA